MPATLIVYYAIGRQGHYRIAMSWLVGSSLFFYAWWNPAYLGLILASILFNYALGIRLASIKGLSRKKLLLTIGISFNLGLIGYYKYANFFIDNLNLLSGFNVQIQTIILPLAISFFTFQQIAYLMDAYKGEAKEYNFLHYCLFVTFFPQLIAGPIVHHKEMLPQFCKDKTYQFNPSNLSIGLSIFFIGLFKKVVIADNLSLIANPIFLEAEHSNTLAFVEAWQGVFAYTFQLYFDFSGYSDMAIGLARMFGILLPLNFASPYQATSIIDFWRRWHITLSRFLKDYLYIPLGGNRKGPIRRYLNLIMTMILGGLWHGAGWTFIIWGTLHGFYLAINQIWRMFWKNPINSWWSIGIARLLTLFFVMVGWVFFKAETITGAMNIFKGMMNLPHTFSGRLGYFEIFIQELGFKFNGPWISQQDINLIYWLFFFIVILWFMPNTQQIFYRYTSAYNYKIENHQPALSQRIFPQLYWKPTIKWGIFIGIVGAIALMSLSQVSEFLYFQF